MNKHKEFRAKQVLQNMGASKQLCICPAGHFIVGTLAVSFTSLLKQRTILFSGGKKKKSLVCLCSFIEQILKQNNISS